MQTGFTIVGLYGIVALSHLIIQTIFAHIHYRKTLRPLNLYLPSVSVVVPVYKEDPERLIYTLQALAEQSSINHYEVLVVDDGSPNIDELRPVYESFADAYKFFHIIYAEKNIGKRNAQKLAFDRAEGDIIVTVDSDTVMKNVYSIFDLVQVFSDPDIGAVTAQISAKNKLTNLFTQLINYRYWNAFNIERAAQSNFQVVTCCSGPLSAYRAHIVHNVKDQYVNQKFLGVQTTFGDDRHLTNLVLLEGYEVHYNPNAEAITYVPENLRTYLPQQLRWNKSFFRETFWTIKALSKHSWYMTYDLIMQFFLPFFLLGMSLYTLWQIIFESHYILILTYLLTIFGIGLLRSLYGVWRTKDVGFLWFMFYGIIHMFLIIPIHFYAMLTVNKTKWGTR